MPEEVGIHLDYVDENGHGSYVSVSYSPTLMNEFVLVPQPAQATEGTEVWKEARQIRKCGDISLYDISARVSVHACHRL